MGRWLAPCHHSCRYESNTHDSLMAQKTVQALDERAGLVLQEDGSGRFARQRQYGAVRAFLQLKRRGYAGDLGAGNLGPAQNQGGIGKSGLTQQGRRLTKRVVGQRPRSAAPWMIFRRLLRGPLVPASHRVNGHAFQTAS